MRFTLSALVLILVCTSCSSDRKAADVDVSREWMPFDYSDVPSAKPDSSVKTTCFYEDLSYRYNYGATFVTFFSGSGAGDSSGAIITVFDKKNNKLLDSIPLRVYFSYAYALPACNDARSYVTGYRTDSLAYDNHYGELAVADFNFDGKEDFAVVRETTVSSGPLYAFFVQGEDGKFGLDPFLTDSVNYFPNEILPGKKMLVTRTHSGVCGISKRDYKYSSASKMWTEVNSEYIDICGE